MAPLVTRDQQLADARRLLDWLEAHPAVPLPSLDLSLVLHNTEGTAAAVMNRASATSKVPFEVTPAGGKVLRYQIGAVSYRLVTLPPPPPGHRRTARRRKPTSTERPTT